VTRRRPPTEGAPGTSTSRSRLESTWTTAGPWRIHSRTSTSAAPPDAPDVVLVHGVGLSSRYMVPTAEHLSGSARVHAVDLPGFGRSSKPIQVLRLPELADALARWAEAVRLRRAVYLGNSFGCEIVVELAIRHPSTVGGAVLVGPTTDPKARDPFRQGLRWAWNARRERPAQVPVAVIDYLQCGIPRAVATYLESLRNRLEEKLPRVAAPTLVVRGGLDTLVPQRWAEEAVQLLPRGRLVVIPGATHTTNFQSPLELSRVVAPFARHCHERATA
jgi:2-hydroxy-6-oxonona-2,4-dienedioate hydrolase